MFQTKFSKSILLSRFGHLVRINRASYSEKGELAVFASFIFQVQLLMRPLSLSLARSSLVDITWFMSTSVSLN